MGDVCMRQRRNSKIFKICINDSACVLLEDFEKLLDRQCGLDTSWPYTEKQGATTKVVQIMWSKTMCATIEDLKNKSHIKKSF
jgi:hypothetical protein